MSHDCWSGPYSAFMRWRCAIAKAAFDIDLLKMQGFISSCGTPWDLWEEDPLTILLTHSDCDGKIEHKDCLALAKRLEELLPNLDDEDGPMYCYTTRGRAERFAKGLRHAHTHGEDVEFR